MCDRSNAQDIVQEMLTYLETADYTIREEMVRDFYLVFPYKIFISLRFLKLRY
jgi:hypothetical protein